MPHGCPADVRHTVASDPPRVGDDAEDPSLPFPGAARVLSDPPYAPGGGRYAAFRRARRGRLRVHGLLRHGRRAVALAERRPAARGAALGGGARAPPADGDVVDGYERRNSSWCVPSRRLRDAREEESERARRSLSRHARESTRLLKHRLGFLSGSSPVVARARSRTRRYKVFDLSGGRSWQDAEDACTYDGGHLATITSASENELVAALLGGSGGDAWIGCNDAEREGAFRLFRARGPRAFRADEAQALARSRPLQARSRGPSRRATARGCRCACTAASTPTGRPTTTTTTRRSRRRKSSRGRRGQGRGRGGGLLRDERGRAVARRGCASYARFVCELEDPVVVETAERSGRGEARYFELLHVHNDSSRARGRAARPQPRDRAVRRSAAFST